MRRTLYTCLVLGMLGFACSEPSRSDIAEVLDALPEPVTETTVTEPSGSTTTSTTTTTPSQGKCVEEELATKSLRPDDAAPTGNAFDEIRERRRLLVGVDENTLGFSSRNFDTGDIEGFEVDLAREIARRIFGDDGTDRVDPVSVVTDEKFDVVEEGDVDMTISANSMTCGRWEDVAFSSEYYTAHQEFLVREDTTIKTLEDLDGATVCVTTNSSSFDLLGTHVPEAERVEVPDRTGCLLGLLEGTVDAYFGHDSFLYGMLLQEPTVKRLDLLPKESYPDTVSHYGIAISEQNPELVRFVNAVLEELRTDGTWRELHHDWLQEKLGMQPADPPAAQYRD